MSLPRCIIALIAFSGMAHGNPTLPPQVELPQLLTLDEALQIFRRQGLDLLIAQAQIASAEGGVLIAGAVPNPVASASVGNALTYSNSAASQSNCLQNGASCSPWINNIGITDSAALEDSLSGKRDLRLKVARNALAAAKLSRVDAERTLAFQVKSAYAQVAQAALVYRFAKEVAGSQRETLQKFKDRTRLGAEHEGNLQRIEVQKLEADQALDTAEQTLRTSRVALAFLLGVRGVVPDFEVDTKVLDYRPLSFPQDVELLSIAFDHRPDLLALGYSKQQTEAQIQLIRRQRFPDITFGINFGFGGFGGFSTNGPIQGQTLTFSVSAPIPVFYNLGGEQRQAEAQHDTTSLQRAKLTAQVVSDIATALALVASNRKLVERMEGPRRDGGGILESAHGAFVAVEALYYKGQANVTDYLDALRTYIATKTEYFGDLASYWTAIFQLEAAVARDLR